MTNALVRCGGLSPRPFRANFRASVTDAYGLLLEFGAIESSRTENYGGRPGREAYHNKDQEMEVD